MLTRPVNTQSLNYMSVSYQEILTETGFVNSAELGRPRKVNETLMPPYREEDQSRSYFFCSLQSTPFPRAELVTTTSTSRGQRQADGEGSRGPRQHSVSSNSRLFEELKLNGHRNILTGQLGLFPRFCVVLLNGHLWEVPS